MVRKIEDFESLLLIDRNGLDEAWINNPEFFRQTGDEAALALSRRDEAKTALERLEAETDLDVREELSRAGQKATEAVVANNVKTNSQVQAAQKRLIEAQREANRWSNLSKSFQQRGDALENLVKLYLAGYFSSDSGGGGTQARFAEEAKRRVAEARNQKRGTQ